MTQLDLFKDPDPIHPKGAKLAPFPLARRRRLVVRTADALAGRKTQQGRDQYWKRLIHDLAADLGRFGASPQEVDGQLMRFHRAVELEHLSRQQQPITPNGAA